MEGESEAQDVVDPIVRRGGGKGEELIDEGEGGIVEILLPFYLFEW